MNKKITKILLSALLIPAAVLPALANTTQLTLTGTVASVLSLQIVKSLDGSVVSTDNQVTTPSYGTVSFGTIDARGLASGTLSGTGAVPAELKKVIIETATNAVFATTSPPASTAGAIYYVPGVAGPGAGGMGYSLLTNGTTGATDVSVASTAASDIRSIVDSAVVLNPVLVAAPTGATSIAAASIQGIGVGASRQIASSLANNIQSPITIGLYAENTSTAVAHTAVLLFTATAI